MSEPRAGLQSTGTTIIDGLVPMPVSVQFSGVSAGDWLALEVTVALVEDPRELGITTPN